MDTAQSINTLVIGAGQAGLATSYWLTRHGVEHQVLERREDLGGAWQDRWDSFYLNTPNFSFMLPALTYDGPEPDAFLPRDAVIDLFRDYAPRISAPVRLGTEVTRMRRANGGFSVETTGGRFAAQKVVLANGAFQLPRIPAASAGLSPHVFQLHSHGYRNPQQLPDGAVLVVGTGQSGGQITEDLLAAGREVHLAVSSCPEAPRRYRGQDVFHWILQVNLHGPEYGINGFQVEQLPSPRHVLCAIRWFPGTMAGTASACGNWAAEASGCMAALREPTTASSPSATTSPNAWRWLRQGSASA